MGWAVSMHLMRCVPVTGSDRAAHSPRSDQTKRNYTGTLYEKGLTSIRPELHMGPRLVRETGSGPLVNSTMQALGTPQAPPSYAEISGSEEKSFADSCMHAIGCAQVRRFVIGSFSWLFLRDWLMVI
jgi:hypothetical protein